MSFSPTQQYDIESDITYLARDALWKDEKPYIVDFQTSNIAGAEVTNHTLNVHPTKIHDVRGTKRNFTLDDNGFCFLKARTEITAEMALKNSKECEPVYFSEIRALLRQNFPEYYHFKCFELTVRERDPTFPWHGEVKLIKFEQPAAIAHSDYSIDGAFMEIRAVFPGQEKEFQRRDFDLLNVWRPLRGPNDDWPLAVCDAETVRDEDTILNDVIHLNRVGENRLLHANEAHRWHYMSGQEVEDCIVFRNCGSSPNPRANAFHAAFNNPRTGGKGRVSAEVRVVAFR